MLTVMSFVSIAVMVILCMRLRRHRKVACRMWVKMMQQECEMDRLRGLLGPNTVQIGCSADFEPQYYAKGGNKYVDTIVCKTCDSLARHIVSEIDHRRKIFEEHASIAQFKDDLAFLEDMDMGKILKNLKS